jgi:hypothetical protein
MGTLKIYKQVSEKEKESDVKNIIEKTKVVISESFSWFELVIAIGIRIYSILWSRNAFKIPI